MKATVVTLLIAGLVLSPLAVWRYVYSFSDGDVGPFYGTSADPPSRQPDQVFSLYDRFQLESYDPKAAGQHPIVVLKEAQSRKVYWCISVNDDSSEMSIRFKSTLRSFYSSPRVKSFIKYNGNTSRAIWLIDESGSFEGYTVWT